MGMATYVDGVSSEQQKIHDYVRYFLFKFLEANGYDDVWPTTPPPGDETSRAIAKIGLEFKERYAQPFEEMFANLDFCRNTAYATFLGIANELFADGIKWGTILALFVLGGELAVRSLENHEVALVAQIENWLTGYIEQHLMAWIREHGGWGGFLQYFDCEKEDSWMRPLVGLAATFFGAVKGLIFRT